MSQQADYGAGGGATEGDRIRDDGITQMDGTIDFGAGGTSIDVTVSGDTSNDSGFEAYGEQGNGDPTNGTGHTGTLSGAQLTASGLPVAATGTNYAVAVTYRENGTQKSKRGSVAGSQVVVGGTPVQIRLS